MKDIDIIHAEHRALVAKLQDDHIKGEQSTHHLRQALRYIDATWKHISLEETELLPLAVQQLAAADWAGIDAAFEANKDPWSGPTGEFRALFTRIVNRVPAPHGLGQA